MRFRRRFFPVFYWCLVLSWLSDCARSNAFRFEQLCGHTRVSRSRNAVAAADSKRLRGADNIGRDALSAQNGLSLQRNGNGRKSEDISFHSSSPSDTYQTQVALRWFALHNFSAFDTLYAGCQIRLHRKILLFLRFSGSVPICQIHSHCKNRKSAVHALVNCTFYTKHHLKFGKNQADNLGYM